MKILTRSILALGFLLLAQTAAKAEEIFLQSVQSGLYVTEINGTLAAATDRLDRALRLDTVRLEGSRIAFRDVRSGSFVRAGVGQGRFLATGSPHISGWETFDVIRLAGRTLALRSVENGKFVRVGAGQRALLAAVSDRAAGRETFRFVEARGGQQHAGRGEGPDLGDIAGHYRITHIAMDDGVLVELGQRIAGRARLEFDESGVVRASIGCNAISTNISLRNGRYRQDGGVTGTRMACIGKGQAEAEAGLIRALEASRRIVRDGSTITFKAANGAELMKIRSR
ncbi:META domain-containing protein [Hoeflea sp.]|uniref:META domain-containing protein n=1 Tax=Hoeflea sp. TaxID=1940281 RepID=UPI0019C95302|nr:META domain-containing protein [Hoeflea sp.]MBC7284894.1 META domain-containing protein [Hoeflea sp.]